MKSDFDYYCTETKRKARQIYSAVGWSGDKLPICNCCGKSPYDGELFRVKHKKIIKTKGA
jgi:hypothetical protein